MSSGKKKILSKNTNKFPYMYVSYIYSFDNTPGVLVCVSIHRSDSRILKVLSVIYIKSRDCV